ncbi:SBBP repeat-containing protein [candidate division WOR-3 bacterium]|nr:SBBP repeat-containing protein [candidate division WOR-3 bacterium]
MKKCLIILLLAAFVIPSIVLAEDPPIEVWVKTGGLSYDDWGEDIAVDTAGYVYVTGNTHDGAGYNWLTVKYDADGNLIWWKTYDSGNGDDIACAVEVDNSGNVYVVGYTPDNTIHDWRYIKYDANGTVLWNKIRDWGPDVDQGCHDIVVDPLSGYFYMTGDYISSNGTWDYLLVKCSPDGNCVIENGWSGGTGVNNNAWALTVDDVGNIYVTGTVWNATTDWGTVKYNAFLVPQWSKIYDSGTDEYISTGAIAVDNVGCVYLAGWVENTSIDWQIVKYLADGTFLWNKTIDTGNNDEGARGVAVDTAGYIYVNGDLFTGTDWDCRTIKLDGNSNIQWTMTYDGDYGNDGGRGVVIDDSEFLYVVGNSYNGTNYDYLTIKYEQQTGIEEQPSVGYSSLLSLQVVNNPTATPTLRYTLPAGIKASLSFYSADGRRIEEFSLNPSHSIFTWNASKLPCGVYFARLEFGNQSISEKICLTK